MNRSIPNSLHPVPPPASDAPAGWSKHPRQFPRPRANSATDDANVPAVSGSVVADRDAEGYIKVHAPTTATNPPGVFAADDVVDHT